MGQTSGVVRGLRALRRTRAWTQEQLAERAGISQGTVSSAEKGLPVNVRTIAKLADALGVTPQELQAEPKSRKRKAGAKASALA